MVNLKDYKKVGEIKVNTDDCEYAGVGDTLELFVKKHEDPLPFGIKVCEPPFPLDLVGYIDDDGFHIFKNKANK